ncbi:hypothetical protein niasHT_024924 [Heterodera trifolii]|uniref:Uncharacterized protein n=1 Tax=Heterodera trifolii TaxID=157864 RepID=A0ABD2KNW9_9BILA
MMLLQSATRVEDSGNLPEAGRVDLQLTQKVVAKQFNGSAQREGSEKIIEKLIDEQVNRMLYVDAPKLVGGLPAIGGPHGTACCELSTCQEHRVMTHVVFNPDNVNWSAFLVLQQQQEGSGPYLFRLFSDSQYCDLSKTYMYLLSSIERKNDAGEWVALSDTDPNDKHVGVIQNFGSSFVRSLKVNISGIEAFHEASCYYPDDDDQNSATNPGFTARAARFSGGKQCETIVKLNFDLARQNALMLNNQDENKKEYRIRVHDMRLYVRTVDVTPSLNLAISRQLESTSAKYPLRKIEMRSIFLGTGRTELAHNVFTSTLPRRLICTFVSTDAYSGNRKMSPYKFEHANVRSISVEANGQTFPSNPYLLSFDGTQPRFVRAFVDMYAGLGLDDSDTKTDTPGFELIRQGTCTIKVQFEQPIKADGFEMLVLGEFDSVLSINADRVLSTDGSV